MVRAATARTRGSASIKADLRSPSAVCSEALARSTTAPALRFPVVATCEASCADAGASRTASASASGKDAGRALVARALFLFQIEGAAAGAELGGFFVHSLA